MFTEQSRIIKPPFGTLPDQGYLSKYGIVGWWLMNEGDGPIIINLGMSGPNNTGTLVNSPVWVKSPWGPAILFNSTNYVSLSTTKLLTSGAPFSISWWEKITTTNNNYPSRFSLGINGSSTKFISVRAVSDVTYSPLSFGFSPTSGGIKAPNQPTLSSGSGIWRHYVITGRDPADNTPGNHSFYVNGVSYALVIAASYTAVSNTNVIGWDGTDYGPEATLSDFRIHNRILTSPEVMEMYLFPFRAFRIPPISLFTRSITTLKTYNGLPQGSIKTMNAVEIASVKTVNGLA